VAACLRFGDFILQMCWLVLLARATARFGILLARATARFGILLARATARFGILLARATARFDRCSSPVLASRSRAAVKSRKRLH
jgi:hypothetical protein